MIKFPRLRVHDQTLPQVASFLRVTPQSLSSNSFPAVTDASILNQRDLRLTGYENQAA